MAENCTSCTQGMFCDRVGLSSPTNLCEPGYYCISGAYTSAPSDGVTGGPCPRGGYCAAGSYEATPCPSGSYNNATGGKTQEDCITCDPGFYCSGTNNPAPTGKCAAGFYCSGGSATPFQYAAPPGYYTVLGSIAPIACNPGACAAVMRARA
jgi:hypothetical protein